MFVALCHFSVDSSAFPQSKDQAHFIQRIRDKVFARFKLLLSEVGSGDEIVLAAALVNRDEHYLRSFFGKILEFIEESEGVRIVSEQLEIIQRSA